MTSLKESESLSSEQELTFLQSLLESKEINALVNVHSKVGKINKDEKFAPIMSSSMQVNLDFEEKLISNENCIKLNRIIVVTIGSTRSVRSIITTLPYITIM